jgi:hypothetical protein
MIDQPLTIAIGVVGILLAITVLWARKPVRVWWRRREAELALRAFRIQREQVEAKFFDMARSLGKPRGLRWIDCDWKDSVTFGREVQSGLITAFAAIEVGFEAIEGGDMEDVEAVGTIREAAAIFHYQRGQWGTGGRALFNMNPADALDRLKGQFEPMTVE